MAIESKYFVAANEKKLTFGSMVTWGDGTQKGVITLIWIGIEEMADILLEDGTKVTKGIDLDKVRLVK